MFERMKFISAVALVAAGTAAATAGGASAKVIHDFYTAKSPAIITGNSPTSFKFQFGSTSTMTCLTNKANGTLQESPTSKLTLEFTHSTCTVGEMAATVDSTTCRYVFSGETDETEHGEMTLECSSGSKMRITANGCTIEIAEQKFGGGVHYEETTVFFPEDIDVTVTDKEILYSATGLLCNLIAGNGKDLSITGIYTMRAYEDINGHESASPIGFFTEPTVFP